MKICASLVCTLALLPAPSLSTGQQWDQWRGPHRDGTADPAALPLELPESLTERWSVVVGDGYAGPLVVGDIVYVFSREDGREILRALSLVDGSELWRDSYPAVFEPEPEAAGHGSGPKATPVFADERIFTFGITGVLSAVDATDGSVIWRTDFAGEFPKPHPLYGVSMSPMVVGERLFAHVGGDEGGAMRAFDVSSGEVLWSNAAFTPGASSPIHVRIANTDVLVTHANRYLIALDMADGTTLWSKRHPTSAATPLVVGDQIVLSGLDTDIFSVRLAPGVGGWEVAEEWRSTSEPLFLTSAVRVGGRIFVMTHRRFGQFVALDATNGERIWATRGREGEYASLTVLGDRIAVLKDAAELIIIDATADDYTPLARYEVAPSATWTPPAFVGGSVLIKDIDTLRLLGFE